VGHSKTKRAPKTDCKLILPKGTVYEMTDRDAWHSVRPLDRPCCTLMVTGKLNGRKEKKPKTKQRTLQGHETLAVLSRCLPTADKWELRQWSMKIRKDEDEL